MNDARSITARRPVRGSAARAACVLALAAALAGCWALALASAGAQAAETTVTYTHEGLAEWEKQFAAGEVSAVTINPRLRSLRTTLKDGRHVVAKYKPKQRAKYIDKLKSKGVALTILSPKAAKAEAARIPVHHKLRYIAAGVLVVIVLIVGGVLFYNRRRKAAVLD